MCDHTGYGWYLNQQENSNRVECKNIGRKTGMETQEKRSSNADELTKTKGITGLKYTGEGRQ